MQITGTPQFVPPCLNDARSRARALAGIVTGLIGLVAVALVDEFILGLRLLREGAPERSSGQSVRSATILLSVGLVGFGVRRLGRGLAMRSTPHGAGAWTTGQRAAAVTALIAGAAAVALFLLAPAAFSAMSLEDRAVEWASVALLFGGAAVMLAAACRRGADRPTHKLTRAALLALAALFIFIGLEEASWFQRQLGYATPAAIADRNHRGEANLHNIATDLVENLYYFGAFALLVAAPFAAAMCTLPRWTQRIEPLLPRPHLMVIGGLVAAFNYDMWNAEPTQAIFFAAVVALALVAASTRPAAADRAILLATLALAVASQAVFLALGERFDRIWEVTEYKELWIALGFAMYAVDTHARLRDFAGQGEP